MEVQEWDDWNSIPSQSVNSEIGIPGNKEWVPDSDIIKFGI